MKHLVPLKLILAFVLPLVFFSCEKRESENRILEEDEFISVYIELLQQGAASGTGESDSAITPAALEILDRHEIRVDDFRETVRYYNTDVTRWKEFFEKVIQRMEGTSQQREL